MCVRIIIAVIVVLVVSNLNINYASSSQLDSYRITYKKEIKDKDLFGDEVLKKKKVMSRPIGKIFKKPVRVTRIKAKDLFRFGVARINNNANNIFYDLITEYTDGFSDQISIKNTIAHYYLNILLSCDTSSKTCEVANNSRDIEFVNDSIIDDITKKLKYFDAEITLNSVDILDVFEGVSHNTNLIWLSVVKQKTVSLSSFSSGYAVTLFPGHMLGQNLCCDV